MKIIIEREANLLTFSFFNRAIGGVEAQQADIERGATPLAIMPEPSSVLSEVLADESRGPTAEDETV